MHSLIKHNAPGTWEGVLFVFPSSKPVVHTKITALIPNFGQDLQLFIAVSGYTVCILFPFYVVLITWIHCEVREKTNKMQQLDVYYQHCLNMFRASLCPSSGEQDVCYCMWCAALVLLDVVGSGCGSAPQPLPTTSSRTSAAHHMQ